MRPDPPSVSILTPSFDQAAWLDDSIASVACQSYPDIEHVVMDGGSTDGSVDVLRAAGDRVVWRSEPDAGQSDAVNKALEASRGEIVGWINSDDAYFDAHVVEDVVACFLAHDDVDVVYGHALQTAEDGAAIQVLWAPPFDADLLRTVDFITQPAAFVRRSALPDPMLDPSLHFALDYDLWLRLLTEGRTFHRLDRVVAIDRHQPYRKSSTSKDVHARDLGVLTDRYGLRAGAEWDGVRSAFYVRQRLMGARLIPAVREPFAFTAPPRPRAGLWSRQLFTPKSAWPKEYR